MTMTQRLIGIYPWGGERGYLEPFSPRLTITSKGSDGLKSDVHYVKSRTEERTPRDIRKRAAIYQRCAVYLHAWSSTRLGDAAERRMAPFHLFHLPDSRTDGSDRIRKRHLIRRRGHFTFCPPVCPSARPSMCRISFPSFSLFAPPTDRPIAPRQDAATAYRSCNACGDRPRWRRDFFSPLSPARYSAQPAVRASIRARGWMVLAKEKKNAGRQKDPEDGHDTTSRAVYGQERWMRARHEWQIAVTGAEFARGRKFATC